MVGFDMVTYVNTAVTNGGGLTAITAVDNNNVKEGFGEPSLSAVVMMSASIIYGQVIGQSPALKRGTTPINVPGMTTLSLDGTPMMDFPHPPLTKADTITMKVSA